MKRKENRRKDRGIVASNAMGEKMNKILFPRHPSSRSYSTPLKAVFFTHLRRIPTGEETRIHKAQKEHGHRHLTEGDSGERALFGEHGNPAIQKTNQQRGCKIDRQGSTDPARDPAREVPEVPGKAPCATLCLR